MKKTNRAFTLQHSRHPELVSGSGRFDNNKMLKQVQHDVSRCKGFTLIELLVVVLIIGILAAVAVPQYQKAVWKSRNAQLKQLVKAVAQAEEAYYMANGVYAANFDELALDLPLTPVATTVGGRTGACLPTTQGTDSSRQGNGFYITLNSTASDLSTLAVVAYHNKGKYKCAGFGWSWGPRLPGLASQVYCRERLNYSAGEGEFCEKLEKASFYTSIDPWRYYKLP